MAHRPDQAVTAANLPRPDPERLSGLVYLFTDFGATGLYVGQMIDALWAEAPGARVIDLFNDAPPFSPRPSAYLLGALSARLQPGSILVGVVDPGVGTERRPILVEWEGRYLIGPDNGLFAPLLGRPGVKVGQILWRGEQLSASFHGRDLFAPVAARLLSGKEVPLAPLSLSDLHGWDWPADLSEVIYIDHYGNAMTGIAAKGVGEERRLRVGEWSLPSAKVFGAVPRGAAFWYRNALDLVEIAVNQGRADETLGLHVGLPVQMV